MNSRMLLTILKNAPVVAILRRPKVDIQRCVKLLIENGIRFIEITMESEDAESFLRSTKQHETGHVSFGAGTVTTLALAKKAMFAGAKFLVTPNFNPEVIRFARDHQLPIFCGAMTPTESFAARSRTSRSWPQVVLELRMPRSSLKPERPRSESAVLSFQRTTNKSRSRHVPTWPEAFWRRPQSIYDFGPRDLRRFDLWRDDDCLDSV